MERSEIEAELNEVERDLADIARRAHIAASNLRSVAASMKWKLLLVFARHSEIIKSSVEQARTELAKARAFHNIKAATVAAGEGGWE